MTECSDCEGKGYRIIKDSDVPQKGGWLRVRRIVCMTCEGSGVTTPFQRLGRQRVVEVAI